MKIRIDITIVPPAARLTSSSPISQAARSKELFLHLREGEKKKFCHDGKTDKETGISYSSDEIMGLIERDNMVLIPAAFSPHDHTGLLFNRLMYGHDTEPRQTFKNKPNANTCEDSARSSRVPHDICIRKGKPRLEGITSSRILWRILQVNGPTHPL